MNKLNKKILLIVILIGLIFPAFKATPHIVKNNGAIITLRGKVFFNIIDLSYKNESNAMLYVHDSSNFSVYHDFQNISGLVNVFTKAKIFTDSNFTNLSLINIYDTSRIIIEKNLINFGLIYNSSLIEIGTCP